MAAGRESEDGKATRGRARTARPRAYGSDAELDQLLAALQSARDGDFSVRLPARRAGRAGEIAAAFNAIVEQHERMAKELQRVSRTIGREGRLTDRAALPGTQGDWATKLGAVNTLIDDLVRPTTEVTRVIDAVAQGDLSQKMQLEIDGQPLKGEFARIGTTVNAMVDQISSFADEVTRVAREVGTEGELAGQAKVPGVSGVWKDLTDNVDTLAANLATQVRNIAEVTTAVASGDLSEEITLDVEGEIAKRATTAIDNARLDREAEERGQAARVLATIGDGVFLLDAGGRIRLWNKAAQTITGLDEADVLGRRAKDAIPSWKRIAERVPVASTGERVSPESVPLDLAGRELWLSVSAVGFEDGTIYAFRDLTNDRALEELRQDLVATVSHELRTPLAAIYGAALTLRRADVDLERELRDKLLEVISEESERLAVIVNDLLLASSLDSGRLQLNIERCDPRVLAASVVETARTHLPETIELRLKAPSKLPQVQADPDQLRQVLTNLVDNAIKYSPDGGPVEVKLASQDGYLRFAISDRGLGIPVREQRRIFEKFYRLDPQMTRGIGGTGLGLYISRELVRRVDGRIWVDSRAGRGSTFSVEIPLARTRSKAKKKEPAAA